MSNDFINKHKMEVNNEEISGNSGNGNSVRRIRVRAGYKWFFLIIYELAHNGLQSQ